MSLGVYLCPRAVNMKRWATQSAINSTDRASWALVTSVEVFFFFFHKCYKNTAAVIQFDVSRPSQLVPVALSRPLR